MAAKLFFTPIPAVLSRGLPAAGAQITFYLAGTLTETPVYTASDLAHELPNPVTADGAGQLPSIYLDDTIVYRVRITDADGILIPGCDIDPYTPGTLVTLQGTQGVNGVNGGVGSSAGLSALFAASSGMSVGTGIKKIIMAGTAAAGISCFYIQGSDVDSVFVAANPLWSFIDGSGQGWRIYPEFGLLPLDAFGADSVTKRGDASGNLTTAAAKNVAAFEAAKACATYYRTNQIGSDGENGTRANLYYFGTPIIWARGNYWFGGNNILLAEGQFHIKGLGSGSTNNSGAATRFQWDGTCNGLTLHSDTSYSGPEQIADQATTSNTIIEGILFDGGGGPLTNTFTTGALTNFNVGLWSRSDSNTIRYCGFDNWSGCGVVVGTRPNQNDIHAANLVWVDHCNFTYCGFAGLYFDGADSNAGGGHADSFIYCGRYGCFDSCLLSNSHEGYHARGIGWGQLAGTRDHSISTIGYAFVRHNGYYFACVPGQETAASTTEPGTDPTIWTPFGPDDGVLTYAEAWVSGHTYVGSCAYRADGAGATAAFQACYIEDDSVSYHFGGPSFAMGGFADVFAQTQGGAVVGVNNGNMNNLTGGWQFSEKRYAFSHSFGGVPLATVLGRFGGNSGNRDIFYYSDSQFVPNGVRLRQGDSEGAISLDYGNDFSNAGWFYTMPSTTYQFGRGANQPLKLCLPEPFLGNGGAARSVTCAAAFPTGGAHAAGEIIFNNAPTAGGKVGWVCTTAGTPGTWKAFGVIDA